MFGRRVSPASGDEEPKSPAEGGPDAEDDDLDDFFDPPPYVPFVDSHRFTLGMGAIVLCNMVVIGIQTDAEVRGDESVDFRGINGIFLLVYMGELTMRLLLRGVEALQDTLTVLDCLLVMSAFIEMVSTGSGWARAAPALRLLRIYCISIEHPWFKDSRELNTLVSNGKTASKSLLWLMVTLLLTLAAASVVARGVVGDSARWVGTMDPLVPHEPFEAFDVREYFGSVPRSVLTILQIMTQAEFANHIGRQVMLVYPVTTLFFYVLIFGTTFGLTKGVIANIVQSSMSSARAKEAVMLELHKENHKRMGKHVYAMLKLVDLDSNGTLDEFELREALENPDVPLVALLLELGVPKELISAENLLRIFDKDGSGDVDYEEMVRGLVSMEDDIQPRDYQLLWLRMEFVYMRSGSLFRRIEELADQVHGLRKYIQHCVDSVEFMIEHRDVTNLHHQAIKMIRNAPYEEPPELKTLRKPPPPRPPSGSRDDYMHAAKRIMGSKRDSATKSDEVHWKPGDPPLSPTVVAAICAGRGVLPDPPGPFEVDKAEAKRQSAAIDDKVDNKYKIRQFDGRIGGIRQSPSLVTLQRLIASESR